MTIIISTAEGGPPTPDIGPGGRSEGVRPVVPGFTDLKVSDNTATVDTRPTTHLEGLSGASVTRSAGTSAVTRLPRLFLDKSHVQ